MQPAKRHQKGYKQNCISNRSPWPAEKRDSTAPTSCSDRPPTAADKGHQQSFLWPPEVQCSSASRQCQCSSHSCYSDCSQEPVWCWHLPTWSATHPVVNITDEGLWSCWENAACKQHHSPLWWNITRRDKNCWGAGDPGQWHNNNCGPCNCGH